MTGRRLSDDERVLWKGVTRSIAPLRKVIARARRCGGRAAAARWKAARPVQAGGCPGEARAEATRAAVDAADT